MRSSWKAKSRNNLGLNVLLGALYTLCCIIVFAIVWAFYFAIYLAYNHFAGKFGWPHLALWEVVVALIVLMALGRLLFA
jgi:hypothetical protein